MLYCTQTQVCRQVHSTSRSLFSNLCLRSWLSFSSYHWRLYKTGGDRRASPSGWWRSRSRSPCPGWEGSGGAPSGAGPALEAQTDKRVSEVQQNKNSFMQTGFNIANTSATFLIFRSIKTMALDQDFPWARKRRAMSDLKPLTFPGRNIQNIVL